MAFDELAWLIGEWTDESRRGDPGVATAGGESWRLQLGGQVLVRTSWCEYPATADEAAFRHDDLLVVFGDLDAQLRAVFWDNHGHVIRYTTATIDPDRLGFAFESDSSAPGPKQRLHYRADGPHRLAADFNLQLPGAASFSRYLAWHSSRTSHRPSAPTGDATVVSDPAAISGVHAIVFTPAAAEVRAFFREVLGLASVDAGDGWPIFALPPAELAVHPADRPRHEIYLMCDDLEATLASLERKGVVVRRPIRDEAWGLVTEVVLPGGTDLAIYQPTHPRPPTSRGLPV